MMRPSAAVLLVLVALGAAGEQPANQLKGFNPNNVYSTHDIDSINVFNGNLTVSIPIGPQFPLAEEFSYGFTLHSNWNIWDAEVVNDFQYPPYDGSRALTPSAEGLCDASDGYTVAFPHRRANAGLGWILTLGRLYPPSDATAKVWTYESPDGADHEFWDTLHFNQPGEASQDVWYTRDGTYLRMKIEDGMRVIQFPNGTRHRFAAPSGPGPWMPAKIEDATGANWVMIVYSYPAPGLLEWKLTDSQGRDQFVTLRQYPWDFSTGNRYLVESVRLMAFTPPGEPQRYATYQFDYGNAVHTTKPDWQERCTGLSNTSTVYTLRSVKFPDDSSTTGEGETKYSFTYDFGPLEAPGVLYEATLPTGGMIRWEHTTYHKPQFPAYADAPYLARSVGVAERKLYSPSGSLLGKWTYVPSLDGAFDEPTEAPAREMRATVTDPLGNSTVSYFSVAPDEYTPFKKDEYGKPFTHKQTGSGGRLLSTVIYPSGVTPDADHPLTGAARWTYVQYESDGPTGSAVDKNWRLASTRVVTGSAGDYVDIDSSEWDGLGHYKQMTVSGSSGNASKKTTTGYRTLDIVNSEWLLNLFTSQEVVQSVAGQADETSVSTYCFAPTTGLLRWKRLRRGAQAAATDLVTAFTYINGDTESELYYGGDGATLPAAFSTCDPDDPLPAGWRYKITHGYSNGVRKSSQYSGASFPSLDLTIDKTGLPSSSRDTAGVETTYLYNELGQLREVHPAGESWSEYTYTLTPSVTPQATVTAKQWDSQTDSPPAGTPLTDTRYYYDAFGRLIQQRRRMPGLAGGNTWSATTTSYDILGRTITQSEAAGTTSGNYAALSPPETLTDYDVLGRVIKITKPDGKIVETKYLSGNTVERTEEVQTSANGTTQVKTKETYDSHGRLIEIAEDSSSANIKTYYAYDEGDRLKSVKDNTADAQVVQKRLFDYDGAGLLMSETHPENGATSYEYDAHGHIKKRTGAGNNVLTFEYDSAERLTFEWDNGALLKEYTYDTSSDASSKTAGKVSTAKRHNRHAPPINDIVVTETFFYKGLGGRLSSKVTAVSGGPQFTDSYEYDQLGNVITVNYPSCTDCGGLQPPPRSVTNVYDLGYLRRVAGYTSPGDLIGYHPNGMLRSLRHLNADQTNGPLYEQQIAANGMARPSQLDLSHYCSDLVIEAQPPATKTVAPGAPAEISLTASHATSFAWYRLGETQPIAGQTTNMLTAPVHQKTTFWARAKNGTCTVDSAPSVVSTTNGCEADATISAGNTITMGRTGTASVAAAATIQWSIAGGSILSGATSTTVTFKANCSGTVTLSVSVTAGCGATDTDSKAIPIIVPTAAPSATPPSIAAGSEAVLAANISGGTGPYVVKWSDNVLGEMRNVSPQTTTTYSIAEINGCPGVWGSATVTVTTGVAAPTNLTATLLSPTSVQLSWAYSGTADQFIVLRCDSQCQDWLNWLQFPDDGSPFVDDTISPNKLYLYRVYAMRDLVPSDSSNVELTSTMSFSTVVPHVTAVQAAQVSQIRTAVNALRAAAGQPAMSFTDNVLTSVWIKAVHFTELQAALNAARTAPAVALPPLSFTPILQGGQVRAVHLQELQGGVQ